MPLPARLLTVCLLSALSVRLTPEPRPAGAVTVSEAWVRETTALRTTSSGYFTVENGSDRAVTVTAVSVQGVDQSVLHVTVDENGTASMKPQKGLSVPARRSVTLAPGGTHVMLTGVRAPLTVGSAVRLTVTFAGAPAQTLRAVVRPLAATAIR